MRFRLNIQLWLVFLWSEGSQCIVTSLHPRAQNCLRNCKTKYTREGEKLRGWESWEIHIISVRSLTTPAKYSDFLPVQSAYSCWRAQKMTGKCEYYSEDPSARYILAPNLTVRKASTWLNWDLHDFFGPLIINATYSA